MARTKRYTLRELANEKLSTFATVTAFDDWDSYKQKFMKNYPRSSDHFVAKDTKTKFNGYSIKKKIGCLVYDEFSQERGCILSHWDCIVNHNIKTKEPMKDLFARLTDGQDRTKKVSKSGRVKSKTAMLNKAQEMDFFSEAQLNYKETYVCYGIYVTWHKYKDYVNITFKYKNITNPANRNRPYNKPFEALLFNIHVKNPTVDGDTSKYVECTLAQCKEDLPGFLGLLSNDKFVKHLNCIHKFRACCNVEIDTARFTTMKRFGNSSGILREDGPKVISNNHENDDFCLVTNVAKRNRRSKFHINTVHV